MNRPERLSSHVRVRCCGGVCLFVCFLIATSQAQAQQIRRGLLINTEPRSEAVRPDPAVESLEGTGTGAAPSLTERRNSGGSVAVQWKTEPFATAQGHEQRGEFDKALMLYRDYLGAGAGNVLMQVARLKAAVIGRSTGKAKTAELSLYLAALDARFHGQFALARHNSAALLERFPNGPLADNALHLSAYIGLLDLGDSATAIGEYDELMRLFPDSPYINNAYYGKALAYERVGDLEEAEVAYAELKSLHTAFSALGIEIGKSSLVSRLWYTKARRALERIDTKWRMQSTRQNLISSRPFVLGMGNRLIIDQPVGSDRNQRGMWHVMRDYGVNVSHLTHWITRETDWRWESKERLAASARRGHTPVISYWYFGDEISPQFVREHSDAYFDDIENNLIPLIKDLPEVYVLLEPEFNKNGIAEWDEWDDFATRAIRTIKSRVPGAKVGLTIGNWGEFEQKDSFDNIEQAVEASDFVGLMAMTSHLNEGANMDPSWSIVERSARLVTHLRRKFEKPMYFAYLAVSTAGNWQEKQASHIKQVMQDLPVMIDHGVFAFSFFTLFDDPRQVGWFDDAEQSFGLIRADGSPKPALDMWNLHSKALLGEDTTGPTVDGDVVVKTIASEALAGHSRQDISVNLSEWAHWRVDIVGLQSGAVFSASGAGAHVQIGWDGTATRGRFEQEQCRVSLKATDKSANVSTIARLATLEIDRPLEVEIARQPALNPGPAVFAWRDDESTLSDIQDGIDVKLGTTGGVNGLSVVLDLGQGFNATQLRQQGLLQFEILLRERVDGVYLGLQDAAGVRAVLLAEAYVDDEQGTWQSVSIPLSEFGAKGWRFADGRTDWLPVTWSRLSQLSLSAVSMPAHFSLRNLRVSRASARFEASQVRP